MLGEVPSGWQVTSLGAVADVILGQSPPSTMCNPDGIGLPFFQGNGEFGALHPVPKQWIVEEFKVAEPTDVLLSVRAPVGELNIASERCVIGRGLAAIRGRAADARFVFYLLHERRRVLAALGQGSTFEAVNGTDLRTLPVALPPLPEQKKIAAILSSVDEAIQATQSVIDQTRRVKEGLLQDLLTRGIGHTRFKQTEIGEIPEGWDIIALGSLVPEDRPICYGILKPGENVAGGVPVVKVKNILDGRIDATDLLFTDPAIDAAYSRSRLQTHDVLLTIRGSTGRVAVAPPSLANANITQDTARLSIDPARANFRFVFFALQCRRLQRHIELHTVGQAVRGINIAEVRKIPIALPPIGEQTRIVDVLSGVDAAITGGQQEILNLAKAKSGLLTDLLTGKVRVRP